METDPTTEPAAADPTPEPAPVRDVFERRRSSDLDSVAVAAIEYAVAELVGSLTTTWSNLLGRDVELTTTAVTPGPRPLIDDPTLEQEPLLSGIGEGPSFVAVAELGPEVGTLAIVIPTALGLSVVDVLLGGTGRPTGDRTLSAIDGDLLHTVVPPTMAVLGRLGDTGRTPPEPRVLRDLEEMQLSDRLGDGALVEFAVSLADPGLPLYVVIGANGVRSLTGDVAGAVAASTPADASRRLMESVLADVVVEAVVTFPPVSVPSHRVLALGIGDVVGLGYSTGEPLPLRVDGTHLADVRPARSGTELACQVVSTTVSSAMFIAPSPRSDLPAPGGIL